MNHNIERKAVLAAGVLAITLTGCGDYITREVYDPDIASLRAADQRLQANIDALAQKYDVLATEVAGLVRIGTGARFSTGDATLREEDKPFLAHLAKVLGSKQPDAVVTVEGFADSQGSKRSNEQLGQQRADAVANFLVDNGLSPTQVRKVSYGEAENRQIRPGAIGPDGVDNRRVSLVVDYTGTESLPMPATN